MQKTVLHLAQEMLESVTKHCEQFINITSSVHVEMLHIMKQ